MDRLVNPKILLVKTSSLGDIIQTFAVLDYLQQHLPQSSVDWAVEERFASIVSCHPGVHQTLALPLKKARIKQRIQAFQYLRKQNYDLVIDLQGNCKSALVTFLARGKQKIGFGRRSVREWPNLLVTQKRYEIDLTRPISDQYRHLVQQALALSEAFSPRGIRLSLKEEERIRLKTLLPETAQKKFLVCPGSKWSNKQLPLTLWIPFLLQIKEAFNPLFLFVFGSEEEKAFCKALQNSLPTQGLLLEKMDFAFWQNLMAQVDLVLAVDSSALHLCATTKTPSFSVFGPTSSSIYKPAGKHHLAVQGVCPYQKQFVKTCPVLRTCPTGSCIRDLKPKDLFSAFNDWWRHLSNTEST